MTVLWAAAGFPPLTTAAAALTPATAARSQALAAEHIVEVNPPFAGAVQCLQASALGILCAKLLAL
jgi:hypothetical protein